MLAVVEGAVALQRTLRLDPQFVIIGADPPLSFPAELGIAAIEAALELTEDRVSDNIGVPHRLHAATRLQAGHRRRLVRHLRGLRGRAGRKSDKRGGEGKDAGGAHATCTSRNMPISMW